MSKGIWSLLQGRATPSMAIRVTRRSREYAHSRGRFAIFHLVPFPTLFTELIAVMANAHASIPSALPSVELTAHSADLFNIDAALTEEERAIRDTVRQFVDEKVLPIIGDCYVEGRFPKELIPELAELGVLGAHCRRNTGAQDCPASPTGSSCRSSSAATPASARSLRCRAPSLCIRSSRSAPRSRSTTICRSWRKAELIGCFGLTEPDYGSNPSGMITRARQQADGSWIINGAKMWITNGSMADIAIIWAKTGDSDDDKSIRGFVVDTKTPGVHRPRPEGQAVAACLRHVRTRVGRRACARRRDAAGEQGPQEPAHVPHAGPLRHLLGRARRGHGLFRGGRLVRQERA